MRKLIIIFSLIVTGVFWFFSHQAAADKAQSMMENMPSSSSPIVVELFTSQGCSSCPPADRVISELTKKYGDKVLPLSFHVDYWDYIGWKDPFASAENTQRQRRYQSHFSGRSIYTPQAVINGSYQMIGSYRTRMFEHIAVAQFPQRAPSLSLTKQANSLLLSIGAGKGKARITLIEYDPEHTTQIPRGENRGETLTNHHIVRQFKTIGEWDGTQQTRKLPLPQTQGFAVILQELPQGRIIAATKL